MIDVGFWALTAACVAATLWFSFVAPPPGTDLFPGADKVDHAVAYFATTMSFLFAAVWRPGRGVGRYPHLGKWFAVAAIAGGGVIEILQSMTATRARGPRRSGGRGDRHRCRPPCSCADPSAFYSPPSASGSAIVTWRGPFLCLVVARGRGTPRGASRRYQRTAVGRGVDSMPSCAHPGLAGLRCEVNQVSRDGAAR